MQVHKIEFFVYCDKEQEAKELSRALYEFVNTKREQGIAVKANKLTEAINKFKDNYFVTNYLK
jgi:hypothetical protein